MTTDREVSRPCVCEGSCPCCTTGEVIDHYCPNCATEFCTTCHGIAKAIWSGAYDNISKCHCKPEVNPLEEAEPIQLKAKPKATGEDVSIYLDIEGRQPAAFRDPALVRGFLKRIARRQEDVISTIRELNKRLSKAETHLIAFSEELRTLKGIYEIGEDEDIGPLVGGRTDG
jgi:hypothetical protein